MKPQQHLRLDDKLRQEGERVLKNVTPRGKGFEKVRKGSPGFENRHLKREPPDLLASCWFPPLSPVHDRRAGRNGTGEQKIRSVFYVQSLW
jgi:hypothetical protein